MKNILKITILIIMLSGLHSCSDVLNTTPEDFVSPEDYYNTEEELNTALSGVYRMLATGPIYGSYQYTLNSISDEYFYRNRTTGPQVLTIDASTAFIGQFWTALYQGIERSNLLLENVDKPIMNDDKRNAIKGEALFLRAYFHFLLVDHFGEVPLKISSTKSPLNTSIARSSIEAVYAQIVMDMKEAEDLVPEISAYNYNGRISKTAVQGILAKVFLTMAGNPLKDVTKYVDAREYALLVINSGLHSLNPSYQQIFINHSQNIYDTKECIWEIEFSGDNTGIVRSAGKLGIVNGILSLSIDYPGFSYGDINTTKKLYDLYETGDLRRDWSISNVSYSAASGERVAVEKPITSTTIYDRQIGKWRRKYEPEPRNQNYNSTNFPVLRYADVLLMFAEAEYYTNGSDGAYESINMVRRRAFGFDPYLAEGSVDLANLDPFQFLETLKEERARELAFEAARAHDLKRWDDYVTTMQLLNTEILESAPAAYKYAASTGSNVTARNVFFPIPADELSINNLATQNVGW